MIALESRASNVLYNFLISNFTDKIYLIPSNVCPVIPLVFLKAGCHFEFCDIDESSLCISEEKVLTILSKFPKKYAGVCFVRTYGVESDFSNFFNQIKNIASHFVIIDDRCLSIPEFESVSENIDIILYSTGYAKYIDLGHGGYGILLNPKMKYSNKSKPKSIHDQIEIKINFENIMREATFKVYKNEKFHYVDSEWLNHDTSINLTDYKNLIIKEKETLFYHKESINSYYCQNLPTETIMEQRFQNWRFNIRVPHKQKLLKNIFDNNLFASSHYVPVAKSFGNNDSFVSTKLQKEVVNLFNNNKVSLTHASKICNLINKHLCTNKT